MNNNMVELINKIGKFYFEKNDLSTGKAITEIESLGIKEAILLEDGNLKLILMRPGLLFGPKGNNIRALEKELGVKIIIEQLSDRAAYFVENVIWAIKCAGENQNA